jgi:Electron transfer flavoprotein, beta subunit
MKILVCVKRVIDHTLRIRVHPDGSGVDAANMKTVMNPFDEIAVEEAVRLKEKGIASEVVAVSIGPQQSGDTIRTALAMGADRGIHIRTDKILALLTRAKSLKIIAEQEKPQLIFLGKQAVDDDLCQTGQMLAELLKWGQGTCASSLVIEEQSVRVTRETDHGQEIIIVPLPAVITADLQMNEPRYASLPNIMKAKKKPLQEIIFEDLDIQDVPSVRILKVSAPPVREPGKRVKNVSELLGCLHDEAGVL